VGAGLAFLIALSTSVTHPENYLSIELVFAVLGIVPDHVATLLAGFFIGSFATWYGTIERLCNFGERRGRQIALRVMQSVCVICNRGGIGPSCTRPIARRSGSSLPQTENKIVLDIGTLPFDGRRGKKPAAEAALESDQIAGPQSGLN